MKVLTRDFGVCSALLRSRPRRDFRIRLPKPRPEWPRALLIGIHTKKIKVQRIRDRRGPSYDVTALLLLQANHKRSQPLQLPETGYHLTRYGLALFAELG